MERALGACLAASPASSRSHLVDAQGTAARLEMMLPEAAICHHMGLIDDCVWGIGHLITVLQPVLSECAVFSRGKREGRVKAAYGTEAICRQRQVVATEDTQAVFQTVPGRLGRHERSSWLSACFIRILVSQLPVWIAGRPLGRAAEALTR